MAIKKFYVNGPKDGLPYDRKANKYFSWGYDIWLNRSRKEERGFLTKQDAEDTVIALKKAAKDLRNGIFPKNKSPYLRDLFDKKLESSADNRHDHARAKRVYEYLFRLIPRKIKVVELRTVHLQQYVDNRIKDGVSAQTVHRELVPIVAALTSGYKYYDVLDDYRPPRIPRPKVSKTKKERVISQAEQDKIFAYLFAPRFEDELKQEPETRRRTGQFLLFCLLSLSRPGEIAMLKRTDIDLDTGIVSITGRKSRFSATQIVRRLKISATMRQILEERTELAKKDFLFTQSGYVTPKMYKYLKAACAAAGVIYSRTDPDGISFHTARHTGITTLVQAGMDLKTIGKLAGHSDSQMTLYYTHANPQMVNQAADLLEKKMGRISGNYLRL